MICAKPEKDSLKGPRVVALVYDGLCTFEFSIAAEVFGLHRPEMGPGWYRFASAAVEPGPLRAHGGLTFNVDAGLERLRQADLIIIPGWKGMNEPVPESLIKALRKAWTRGARLASICSGAFVLAATGLLDGRRVATHWRYAKALADRYPVIDVDADVLYLGTDRIYTSAGSAAGLDLMLNIIRDDFGSAAANSVARRLVIPAHRDGGQAQFIERPVGRDRAGTLASLLDEVRMTLSKPWSVMDMANRVTMSKRTFLRRFKEATGTSPARWLATARIDEARRLLEVSSHSIERIATDCGFASVQVMRSNFRQVLLVTPSQFRAAFARQE